MTTSPTTAPTTSPRTSPSTAPGEPAPVDVVRRASFVSADGDEIASYIGAMYSDIRPDFTGTSAHAQYSSWSNDVTGLGADRVETGVAYTGRGPAGFDDFIACVVRSGRVRMGGPHDSVLARAGDAIAAPVGLPAVIGTTGFAATVLRVPVERLRRVAEEITGQPTDVRFHALAPVSPPLLRYWRG